MSNRYYSIRMYVEEYPSSINCQDLLEMADEISKLLGCNYDHLGYMLLDPDYDFKDLGVMLKNNKKNREKFLELSIPQNYYGHEEEFPASPLISFELKPKDNITLPFYSIDLDYPTKDSQYLSVRIDIKEDLLSKELTLVDFNCVQDIVSSKGYIINSAFMHYYLGNSHRTALDGIECGFVTINDWRIIKHSIRFSQEWKDKIMDVFYMNSFNKEIVSKDALENVVKIVGDENVIDCEQKIVFKLPQSKSSYLLNRIIPMKSRHAIKKILQKENICFKDAPIIASILKL